MDPEIAAAGAPDVDGLRDLWLQMLSHHRGLVGDAAPVRAAEESWLHARSEYRAWLENETAVLFVARSAASSHVVGYVLCRLLKSGPTFALGSTRGEVDSLVVDDRARGEGVGTALLDAVRRELVSRKISYWSVGVLAQNEAAIRLYRRLGFHPWTQQLLAPTSGCSIR